jgi:hypothetical protein
LFAVVYRRLAKIVEGKVEEDKLRTQHANRGAATGVRMQPIPPEKVVKMARDMYALPRHMYALPTVRGEGLTHPAGT